MITRGRLKELQRENAHKRLEATILSSNRSLSPNSLSQSPNIPTVPQPPSDAQGDINTITTSQNTENSCVTDATYETCGICFTPFSDDKESPKATLDTCDYHLYCLPCIVRWAAQCTRCPLCRVRFEYVFVLDKPESRECINEVIGHLDYNRAVSDGCMTDKKRSSGRSGGKNKRVSLVPMTWSVNPSGTSFEMLEIKFKSIDFSDFEPGYEFDDLMSNNNNQDEDNLTGDESTTDLEDVDNDGNNSEEEEKEKPVENEAVDMNFTPSIRESHNDGNNQITTETSSVSSPPPTRLISVNDGQGQEKKTERDNRLTPHRYIDNDQSRVETLPMENNRRHLFNRRLEVRAHANRRQTSNTLQTPPSVAIPIGGNAFDGRALTGCASPHLVLHNIPETNRSSSSLSLSGPTFGAPRVIRVKRERYCDNSNISNNSSGNISYSAAVMAVNGSSSDRQEAITASKAKAPTATNTRVRDLLSRINDPSSGSYVVPIPANPGQRGNNLRTTVSAIMQDNLDGLAELDRRKNNGGQNGFSRNKVPPSNNDRRRGFVGFGGSANNDNVSHRLSEEEEYTIVYNNTLSALRGKRRIDECGPRFDSFGNVLRVTLGGLHNGQREGGLTAAESLKRDNIIKKQASDAARAAIQMRRSKSIQLDDVRKTREEALQIRREELALMKMRALLIAAKAKKLTTPG